MHRCLLLATQVRGARPPGEDRQPTIREALRAVPLQRDPPTWQPGIPAAGSGGDRHAKLAARLRYAPPAIRLGRQTANALTFNLDQSLGAGHGTFASRTIRPSPSTTQTLVHSNDTSNPAKYFMAAPLLVLAPLPRGLRSADSDLTSKIGQRSGHKLLCGRLTSQSDHPIFLKPFPRTIQVNEDFVQSLGLNGFASASPFNQFPMPSGNQ